MREHASNFRSDPNTRGRTSKSTAALSALTRRTAGLRPSITCCLLRLMFRFGNNLADAALGFFINTPRGISGPGDRLSDLGPMLFFDDIKRLCGLLLDLSELSLGNEVGFGGHAVGLDTKISQR